MHAYLIVAEAVDGRNKEALKREGKNTVQVIFVLILLFSKQYDRLPREGLMKEKKQEKEISTIHSQCCTIRIFH